MNQDVLALWPEIEWIEDMDLREATAKTWELALERSPLTAEDLNTIPFTLLVPDLKVSFMAHKRSVVHVCRDTARIMREFYGDTLPIDDDVLMSGAILIDVGKLLEYERDAEGKVVQSNYGSLLRHPFSGVGLAMRFDLPAEVCPMIAMPAKEGDTGQRTIEGIIVHHADFMTFEPFKLL